MVFTIKTYIPPNHAAYCTVNCIRLIIKHTNFNTRYYYYIDSLATSSAMTYMMYPMYIPTHIQASHFLKINCGRLNITANMKKKKIQNNMTTEIKFSVKSIFNPLPPEKTNIGNPKANKMSNMLDPKTFDIAILPPFLSFLAVIKDANASGADVPIAVTVKPMTVSLILIKHPV